MKEKLVIGTLGDIEEETIPTVFDSLFSNVNIVKLLILIAGKKYVVNLENLLRFSKEVSNVSDVELDNTLEKITAWLYTLISANISVKKIKKKHIREVESWKAKKINEVRSLVVERNPNDTRIFREVLLNADYKTQYESYITEIDDLEEMTEKMDKLYEILKIRNENLRTIIRNRRELKGGHGRDQGV
jgi:hypothetical protein